MSLKAKEHFAISSLVLRQNPIDDNVSDMGAKKVALGAKFFRGAKFYVKRRKYQTCKNKLQNRLTDVIHKEEFEVLGNLLLQCGNTIQGPFGGKVGVQSLIALSTAKPKYSTS